MSESVSSVITEKLHQRKSVKDCKTSLNTAHLNPKEPFQIFQAKIKGHYCFRCTEKLLLEDINGSLRGQDHTYLNKRAGIVAPQMPMR